jgi:hypothetical protein
MTTTMTSTQTAEETEYLERLARFEPEPLVEEDARWALTIKGARALGAEHDPNAFAGNIAVWRPWVRSAGGRWCER